ncbi:MAG: SPOR domain-containing protein [Candidatus Thiodiazotropha sp.]
MSDSNQYFSTPENAAHIDLIRHLIENSELVPLVRGAAGSGKTLMASKLRESASENWSVCHFSAEPALQPERLLAFIARCSGLADLSGELLPRLVERFEALRKNGRIPVLLVDDAQMLPPTSLIILLRLFERQVDGIRLISIVLFADEQIDLLLATPQLQVMSPQVIQAIDLPVITREQVTDFMHFLLNREGLSEQFALDAIRLRWLHKDTGGNPGPLAAAILSEISLEKSTKQPFFSGYKKQLILGGVPFLVLVLMLLLFQEQINDLFEPPDRVINSADPALLSEVAPKSSKIILKPPVDEKSEVVVERDMTQVAIAVPDLHESLPEPPKETEQAVTTPQAVTTDTEANSSATSEHVSPGEVASISDLETPALAAVNEATHVSVKPAKEMAKEAQVIAPSLHSESPEAAKSEVEEMTQQAYLPTESDFVAKIPDAEEAISIKTSRQTGQSQKSTGTPNRDPYDKALDWVLSQPPQNYTLQLIAVENIHSLERFVKVNKLEKQTYTLKTKRKGRPWHSLLWGSFASRKQAIQAQKELPPAIQKAGVWVRAFGSIKH